MVKRLSYASTMTVMTSPTRIDHLEFSHTKLVGLEPKVGHWVLPSARPHPPTCPRLW